MAGIQVWCTEPFLFWEDNKLIAQYVPGQRYNCVSGKPKHDRLHVLMFGGVMPKTLPIYVEDMEGNIEDRYDTGDTLEGWVNEGKFSLLPPTPVEPVVGGDEE